MKASEAGKDAGSPFGTAQASAPLAARDHTLCILALATLMLATRPFLGIIHDANLYAVQALKALGDNNLGEDLFFRYGNQGSFSLFGPIWNASVAALGLALASVVFWAMGLALWLAGLITLTRTIFDGSRAAYIAAGFVLVLYPGYGNGTLSYGEGFVTARIFTETLALFALAALWQGRHFLGGGLLIIGAALHPLLGFAAILVGGWIALNNWRRYALLALLGIAIMLALAFAGISPFTWLIQQFDPEWYAITQRLETIVYPDGWHPVATFSTSALPVTVLIIASLHAGHRIARLSRELLILAAIVFLISVIGSSLLANRLITSMQLWRVLLFVSLFGNMFILATFPNASLWMRSAVFMGLAAIFAIVETLSGLIPVGSAAISLSALISFIWENRRVQPLRPWQVMLVMQPALWGGLFSLSVIAFASIPDMDLASRWEFIARLVIVTFAMTTLLKPQTSDRKWQAAGPALAISLLLAAMIADNRNPLGKYIDSATPVNSEVAGLLHGKTVYWEKGRPVLWYKLKMPSYYDCWHKAGIIFFRGQAMEFDRRAQVLRELNTIDFAKLNPCPRKADPDEDGPTRRAQLEEVCSALPELDVLVLRNELPGTPPSLRFSIPVPDENEEGAKETTYRIYDCADFRSARQ